MLTNLHVKNVALIDEAEIEFKQGLNILSGETGAGKSIVLGAVNLALGGKAGADLIGRFGESALVELGFHLEDQDKIKRLEEMDIFPEDGNLMITRRILQNRSVIKVNGETVTAANVRKITELLIDIHGQHDHQSLLYTANHLEILDRFAKEALKLPKEQLEAAFARYSAQKQELEQFTLSEEERNRTLSFLRFEVEEIQKADLKPQEDEIVENAYKKMLNAKKIAQELGKAYAFIGTDTQENASELLGRACAAVSGAAAYDRDLEPLGDQLSSLEEQLHDAACQIQSYMDAMEYEEQVFYETENRLNTINHLKSKYGQNLEEIETYARNAKKQIAFYEDYETRLAEAQKALEKQQETVTALCGQIHTIRSDAAEKLSKQITKALTDLNFGQVRFEIKVKQTDAPTKNGMDAAEFLISVNPGEDVKPLAKVASGGELSRIMLGIKSVLAGKDEIDTLIFDEIDTGISGRTAQKVSEKMAVIAKNHQIICITHLPQIASMADHHFLIEKSIDDGYTQTCIRKLEQEETVLELSRMLGGTEITPVVMENAKQMKTMADALKQNL